MDRSGIAAAILSRPAIPISEPEKARKLARDANEFAAQVVRDHPGRFGLFATLPLFDVEGSLREIEYGFDVLKADGVCFSTSYGNKWIGDPTFAPVLEELNRRGAVVFVHPTPPGFYTEDLMLQRGAVRGQSGVQPAALEMMFDSARAIVSLILNGMLYRCPDIRFIFGHGGGTLPYLHERLDHLIGEDLPTGGEWTTGDGRYRSKYVPNGFVNEMKKVYFDVVRVANRANFAMLRQLMPLDRLLLGTDYPIVPTSETVGHLPNLGLDSEALRRLERDNAVTLFRRFAV
jgi:predicted TIM-barrel fold metal-dependent hydrolase